MVSERYTQIENYEILFFELEASGWCGSIRLVEAVLTKLAANSRNTGKIKNGRQVGKTSKNVNKRILPHFLYMGSAAWAEPLLLALGHKHLDPIFLRFRRTAHSVERPISSELDLAIHSVCKFWDPSRLRRNAL